MAPLFFVKFVESCTVFLYPRAQRAIMKL